MIIDGHTHLFSKLGWLKGIDEDEWRQVLEHQGVDAAVVFTLEGFRSLDTEPFNDQLAAAIARHPDFMFGLGTVHPLAGQAALDEMDRCVLELGFKGFKFHPWLQAFCASAEEICPLVAKAGELGVPVLLHDGTPPYSSTLQAAYLARRYPQTTIILGHSGLRDQWPDALLAAQRCPNIVLQWCGTPFIGMQRMLEAVGPNRCIFGSDYPVNGRRGAEYAIAMVKELKLSPTDEAAIFANNTKRILNL